MRRKMAERLADPEVIALKCKGADWPRTLLSETPTPDGWLTLVVQPDGRRRLAPPGQAPDADRDDNLVLVRDSTLVVALDVPETPASCGHPVSGSVELVLRPAVREDDLAALGQVLLDKGDLTAERLGEVLGRAGAEATLRAFIRQRKAAELVYEDQRGPLCRRLRDELARFLFSAGLVLERIGRVELSSESLARHEALRQASNQQVREIEARELVERAAMAAAQRRLDELGTVLAKLKTAAEADGSLRWRELLPTLAPSERGRLLENLWRLTPDAAVTQSIVVVSGQECVWLDPTTPERIVRRISLPDEMGGLRSVTFDAAGRTLLVGAASGVWRLDADTGEIGEAFVVPEAEPPRTGFNSAVVAGERLVATHSQLGAWSWKIDDISDAVALLRPESGVPKTIRAATIDAAGSLLLAADDEVRAFDAGGESLWWSGPTLGAIHCLTPLGDRLFAGTARGALLCIDLGHPEDCEVLHRASRPIESITARRWDDLTELVIPAGERGVCGVYAEEGIVSCLLDASTPVRRAWACDDTLAALTHHRDRLIVLNGEMPTRTGREVPIARTLGHSIQDACLVVSQEAGQTGSREGAAPGSCEDARDDDESPRMRT